MKQLFIILEQNLIYTNLKTDHFWCLEERVRLNWVNVVSPCTCARINHLVVSAPHNLTHTHPTPHPCILILSLHHCQLPILFNLGPKVHQSLGNKSIWGIKKGPATMLTVPFFPQWPCINLWLLNFFLGT